MIKLRSQGLTIYDPNLEQAYINLAKSYDEDIKKTKAKSESQVAKVGDIEYSADKLFELMDERYGITFAICEINNLRLLNNL